MLVKYKGDKLVWMTEGENLIESAVEGADILIEHFDRDGLDIGMYGIHEVGRLKYHDQGRAIQRHLADNESGKWLRDYIEATFSQYFGREGEGSICQIFKNKQENPGRLRTELECFRSAMVMANNYAKEHPEAIAG
jgi:hypothetical protein